MSGFQYSQNSPRNLVRPGRTSREAYTGECPHCVGVRHDCHRRDLQPTPTRVGEGVTDIKDREGGTILLHFIGSHPPPVFSTSDGLRPYSSQLWTPRSGSCECPPLHSSVGSLTRGVGRSWVDEGVTPDSSRGSRSDIHPSQCRGRGHTPHRDPVHLTHRRTTVRGR